MTKKDKRTLLYIFLVIICVVLIIFIINAMLTVDNNETGTLPSGKNDYIAFLDVGQGDGALLKSGSASAVIDTGTPEGAEEFCGKLKSMGVGNINTLLLTHNHDDHIGGSANVSKVFKVSNLILPDLSKTDSSTEIIKTAKTNVEAASGEVKTAKSGMFYSVGNIKLSVLCCYTESNNENERSIISIAELGGKRFLFTGDAGKQTENQMIKDGIQFDCDVLKAGHHGSRGSSTANFLAIASPQYVIISCGADNQYKHPHEEAVSRIKNAGAIILRTDQSGDITFYVIDKELEYKTQK